GRGRFAESVFTRRTSRREGSSLSQPQTFGSWEHSVTLSADYHEVGTAVTDPGAGAAPRADPHQRDETARRPRHTDFLSDKFQPCMLARSPFPFRPIPGRRRKARALGRSE